jgi:hypothetical protein
MLESTLSFTKVNESHQLNLLITFLQETLKISGDSLNIALRQSEQFPHQLPMILWQYGLISLEELEKIFDWWDRV